jgi:hypothetical protein
MHKIQKGVINGVLLFQRGSRSRVACRWIYVEPETFSKSRRPLFKVKINYRSSFNIFHSANFNEKVLFIAEWVRGTQVHCTER